MKMDGNENQNQDQDQDQGETLDADVDLFDGRGVRVKLCDRPGSFLTVKETLTRMGIPSRNNVLSQSCHILHRRGQYAIVHFKEMFLLNGRSSTFSDVDEARRDGIVLALQTWGLVTALDDIQTTPEQRTKAPFRVIKFGDRDKWTLNSKYTFSKRHKDDDPDSL